MAIIKKYNKENGTTYVYESVSYWDKEKQQPRSKRKLIGKVDPITGETIPTGTRGRKSKVQDIDLQGMEISDSEKSIITPSVSSDAPDYKSLYEDQCRLLLEKEAQLAKMEAAVNQLTSEKQNLVDRLEKLIREYGH